MSHAAHPIPEPVGWDDFVSLDEDDPRELIDGVLKEIDVPNRKHEWIVARLVHLLSAWAEARRAGIVLASGYKVRITDRRGVMPDVQFIRQERAGLMDDGGMTRGGPDLAVEVISPSSGKWDRWQKLEWYASISVPEYWIVDAQEDVLERLVLGADGRYVVATSVGGDAIFRPDSFPGLEIDLSQLWRLPQGA